MRVMLSILREPSADDKASRVLAPIRFVAMSYDVASPQPVVTLFDNSISEEENYQQIAATLSKTDVVPYGWNLREDVWPCLLFNMFCSGATLSNKLQNVTDKWSNVSLGDLTNIVGQGWRMPGVKLEDVVQGVFPEYDWEVCSEEKLAQEFEDIPELRKKLTLQHVVLWKLLEKYRKFQYGE